MAEGSEDDLTQKPHSQPASRSSPSSLAARTNDEPTTATLHSDASVNLPPQKNEISQRALTLESQPMTKTSSASSVPSGMAVSTADNAGPSPYGTRSRNKAGNARPNYAEDREMDVESDWAAAKKSQASGGAGSPGQALAGDSDKSTGVNTRRSSNTTPASAGNKAGPTGNTKDGIPGMSSFSLNSEAHASPLPANSKKRKAPGGGVAASTASHNSGPATSHGTSRRAATTVSSARYRETNMLTFEDSQGYLKDGKLQADDGTNLSINGESDGCDVRGFHFTGAASFRSALADVR